MSGERFTVRVRGGELVGSRWPGSGTPVVLLHSGVCDRRSWYEVAASLGGPAVAYDRRGHGDSPRPDGPFSNVEDLVAVLDAVGADRAFLVGSSRGGGLALDTAVTHPDRVAGLLVITPSVSGIGDAEETAEDQARYAELDARYEAAEQAKDLDAINAVCAWLWLDGPVAAEGRVTGPARELALEMNRIVLDNEYVHGMDAHAGDPRVDAWSGLPDLRIPATVAWGELDVPALIRRCAELVERIPGARGVALPGTAHLPYLDAPAATADLVKAALAGT